MRYENPMPAAWPPPSNCYASGVNFRFPHQQGTIVQLISQTISPAQAALTALPPDAADDALFAAVGAVEGLHVLVIGGASLDILCGLIRRGCTAAAEISLTSRHVGADPADVVILSRMSSLTEAAGAMVLAARLVLPGGRLVLRDSTGRLAGAIAAILPQHGFSAPRRIADGAGVLLVAERPFFGPHLQPAHMRPAHLLNA